MNAKNATMYKYNIKSSESFLSGRDKILKILNGSNNSNRFSMHLITVNQINYFADK